MALPLLMMFFDKPIQPGRKLLVATLLPISNGSEDASMLS
jgi:hypothetical protein